MQGFQEQDSHELLRVLLEGIQAEESCNFAEAQPRSNPEEVCLVCSPCHLCLCPISVLIGAPGTRLTCVCCLFPFQRQLSDLNVLHPETGKGSTETSNGPSEGCY